MDFAYTRSFRECRGKVEGAFGEFDEASFFAKDETLGLGEREVVAGFGIFAEAGAVGFVRGEGVEGDERPADVVGAFRGGSSR